MSFCDLEGCWIFSYNLIIPIIVGIMFLVAYLIGSWREKHNSPLIIYEEEHTITIS